MNELSERSSTVAVSVWTATASPSERRLLYYNESYKCLCDVTSFGEGRLEDCMPSCMFFTRSSLRDKFHAAMQDSIEKFNQVQSGETSFTATNDGFHLSKLGRLHHVSVEWYLLMSNNAPRQVLVAEFITPEEVDKRVPEKPSVQEFRVHPIMARRWTSWGVEDGSTMLKKRAVSKKRKCQVCETWTWRYVSNSATVFLF